MRNKWKLLLALLAIFSLVAAACGDDDDDETGTSGDESSETEEGGEEEGAEEEAPEDEGDMDEEAPEDEGDMDEEDSEGESEGDMDEEATGEGLGEGFNVGLTFDLLGRGDQSFNDSAAAGIDRAKEDFGVNVSEITPVDASARGTDLQLQAENAELVIGVGFSFAADAATVAAENPDVKFAIIDDSMMNFDTGEPIAPNAAGLVFSEEQGSYLVGVAAALKTTTNKVGFIGGMAGIGLIEKFEAGFEAGAKSINPDIEIVSQYITEFPDFAGFEAPDRAKEIGSAMYEEGADIIYAAAGLSGSGMFQAAAETTEATGTKVWGIGVDSDQYLTVDPAVQEYVLTSMLKRVDNAVYLVTEAVANGTFVAGETRYDLASGGVGYSTSGGFIDDITDQIDAAADDIISGAVEVPTTPGG